MGGDLLGIQERRRLADGGFLPRTSHGLSRREIHPDRQEHGKLAESFSQTIYKLLGAGDHAPPDMCEWLQLAKSIIARTGFPDGLDIAGLTRAFEAHIAAVKAVIPVRQLLVYDVKEGWAPLCAFLGVPEPAEAFPRTNNRAEFWDRVSGKM